MFDKKQVLPIGTDHAGFSLKEFLIEHLTKKGYNFKDYGPFSDESVDYPDFIHPVAKAVNNGEFKFGIIMCGSGQGANMTANKYPNVRAALCWNVEQAKLSRQHNNANIISLPGRYIDFEQAEDIVEIFLHTDFEGGRHLRRLEKMVKLL